MTADEDLWPALANMAKLNPLIPGLLLILLSTGPRAAEEIIVEHVSSELVENSYYLDARINFNLHDDLLEALDHGVDLDVHIIVKVKEQRKWLWDRLYRQDTIKFKLGHLPLSNVYIVSNLGNSRQRQFDTLENALKYLGTLDRYYLLNNETSDDKATLVGLLKAELNVENLPSPLKPVALILNKWQSDSQWRQWIIRE